jgi:succinoglycan biosynthesis protein ExoM
MSDEIKHVTVCICTFVRPRLLRRLLEKLNLQHTEGRFNYSIVVADNDRSRSAEQTVIEFAAASSIQTTYCFEPEQNIALARNAALRNAKGNFIAFIDDDEFPAENWLLTLLKTCSLSGVDGVIGPVKPYFEQEPPKWVTKGKFYDRPTHDTGFIIDWSEGRTGNLLFDRRILTGLKEPFSSEFGSGSEDTDFFRRMIESGYVFMWCDEAVVFEVVPPTRWKRSFMLRRSLLRGKNSLRYPTGRMRNIAKSVVAIPIYVLALPFLLVVGHHLFMKCLIKLFDHAGRLLALFGLNPIGDKYVTE